MPFEEFGEDLDDCTDDEVERMCQCLCVHDLHHDWLNTIIVFDDVGNSGLFKNKDSYFNNRLKLCRDDNAIYFLTIHGITQMSPSVKQNTATVHVYKGLSNERLAVIHRQLNIPLDWKQFKESYHKMASRGARYMVVDNIAGDEPKIE
jgi:hypothetical protein